MCCNLLCFIWILYLYKSIVVSSDTFYYQLANDLGIDAIAGFMGKTDDPSELPSDEQLSEKVQAAQGLLAQVRARRRRRHVFGPGQADERPVEQRAERGEGNRTELDVSISGTPPVDSSENDARRGMPDLDAILEIGPSFNILLARAEDRKTRLELRLPVRADPALAAPWRAPGGTAPDRDHGPMGGAASAWGSARRRDERHRSIPGKRGERIDRMQ